VAILERQLISPVDHETYMNTLAKSTDPQADTQEQMKAARRTGQQPAVQSIRIVWLRWNGSVNAYFRICRRGCMLLRVEGLKDRYLGHPS
jgi:hypothetical protein